MRRRAKPLVWVTLDWGDRVGFNSRTLPVAFTCPDCDSPAFKRLDTHRRCRHSLYIPVECLRCKPPAFWAQPRAPGTSAATVAATVAAAERRSLRARVSGFVDALVARMKGKKTGGNHGS